MIFWCPCRETTATRLSVHRPCDWRENDVTAAVTEVRAEMLNRGPVCPQEAQALSGDISDCHN